MNKIEHIVNIVLFFFCIFGFCYQVHVIFSQYILGKTVVNIEVKRLKTQPFPAITVCVAAPVSVLKLSYFNNSRNIKLHHDYMKLLNDSKANRNFTDDVKVNLKKI